MKIGFIGLGIMGKPMAKNLIKAGYELVVCDLNEAAVKELTALGAEMAESPIEVGNICDVVITMLPNSPHVKSVVLGENGLIRSMKSGSIVIDNSSISPIAAREVASELAAKGIRMLDAPVSGGEPGAISGQLAIMVGGAESDFNEFRELIAVNAKSVVRVGDIGSGNVAKLVNQSIVAINIAAVAEAMMLGKLAGTDPEKIFDAIKAGLAGSNVMNAKMPMMLNHDFKPGFRLSLHKKDLQNVLETAGSAGMSMPFTELAAKIVYELVETGDSDSDHSAMLKYFEKLVGKEL